MASSHREIDTGDPIAQVVSGLIRQSVVESRNTPVDFATMRPRILSTLPVMRLQLPAAMISLLLRRRKLNGNG